jgi:hypothetical protein
MRQNRHFVLVSATASQIFPQILLWGEAKWWPEKSQMKFICLTPGNLTVGTRFVQKVLLPFGPQWEVEINRIEPDKKVGRRFLNGIFKGEEWVELEPAATGTKVNYVMNYDINGAFNRVMWKLFFRRLHDKNIEMILANLSGYIKGKR